MQSEMGMFTEDYVVFTWYIETWYLVKHAQLILMNILDMLSGDTYG